MALSSDFFGQRSAPSVLFQRALKGRFVFAHNIRQGLFVLNRLFGCDTGSGVHLSGARQGGEYRRHVCSGSRLAVLSQQVGQ
jgi:hypothetical protein